MQKTFFVCSLVAALAGCPSEEERRAEVTLQLFPESGLGDGQIQVAFVAYQDGDGAWQPMPGNNGTYSAVVGERYGIAVGCLQMPLPPSQNLLNLLNIQHRTLDEQTELRDLSCYRLPQAESTITGTATGLAQEQVGTIHTGRSSSVEVMADGRFSITAATGTHPMFGTTRMRFPGSSPTTGVVRVADAVIPSSSPIAIDFSKAVAPAAFPVTWPANMSGSITTAVRRDGSSSYTAEIVSHGREYRSVPASLLQAGEILQVSADVQFPDAGWRWSTELYLSAPEPVSIELAEPVEFVDATVPSVGRRLASFALPALASPYPFVEQRFRADTYDDAIMVSHRVTLSRGWVGSRPVSYTIPDLSAIPGHVSTLDLLRDRRVLWELAREESNMRELVAGRRSLTYAKSSLFW